MEASASFRQAAAVQSEGVFISEGAEVLDFTNRGQSKDSHIIEISRTTAVLYNGAPFQSLWRPIWAVLLNTNPTQV